MNFDEQIDRSFEGKLTQSEWDQLQKAILADSELRKAYVERRWLHAQLLAASDRLPSLLEDGGKASMSHNRRPFLWLNAAAVVLLFGLVAALSFRADIRPTVATLIEAEGCRWEASDLPTREGAKLGPGTLALAEGMATIRFDSGATVTLEAPTTLEVTSAMHCQLVEGSVVTDVPESAHGFTIDTEKMKVVDLGTRFGLTTNSLGGSQVYVFEGEVKVHRDDQSEAKHLLTGKSMHTGMSSTAPGQEIDRSIQRTAPKAGNWTPISTAIGRGRDGYIRRGDAHGPASRQPVVMVKHTDLAPTNERRGLLTFDLASLGGAAIADAILTLKIESSGLGFAAMVPDSKFAVYGVLDPAIDDWREDELTWGNPVAEMTAENLDPSRYVRLAEFEIKKGASHGLVEVSSESLNEHLNQHRSGRSDLISLLLVRETGEMDSQGLVHAFASKEHPTGQAPTLWIETNSSTK